MKMNFSTKRIATLAALATTCLAFVEPSLAQDVIQRSNSLEGSSALITMVRYLGALEGQSIGKVVENLTGSLKGVSVLITMICYLCALLFGLVGALKWRAYGEQPDRTPFKIPVTYWGVAVLLAVFPEFLEAGVSTVWGTAAGGSGPTVIKPH